MDVPIIAPIISTVFWRSDAKPNRNFVANFLHIITKNIVVVAGLPCSTTQLSYHFVYHGRGSE